MGPRRIVPRRRKNIAGLLGTFALLFASFCCNSKSANSAAPAQTATTASSASPNNTATTAAPAAAGVVLTRPTAASLSPAAEDIICAIGATQHLVGVSNYDATPAAAGLPRVGDYQSVDWEKLTALHPDLVIVQIAPDRLPPGLADRCAALPAKLVNVQIETLADIHREMLDLGTDLNEQSAAQTAAADLQRRLDDLRQRYANLPRVRTLLVDESAALSVIGPGTFLDELLTIAGGSNVMPAGTSRYPSIDRETLEALAPSAVVLILPSASPQVREQATQFWAAMPQVPAVREHRIIIIDDPRAQIPGAAVAQIAQQLAAALHPGAASQPSTP